jgi:hypothetical protein
MTKRKPRKKKEAYLTNAELLPVLLRAKEINRITPELGKMLILLVDRYAEHPWWCGYSPNWLNELKSEAIVALCRGILKFNPNYAIERGKKPNAFAYATTIVYRSFKSSRDKEKKHSNLEEILPNGMY